MVSVIVETVAWVRPPSWGRCVYHGPGTMATAIASRTRTRISHFRQAFEWMGCGGETDTSDAAWCPSVVGFCGSVWNVEVRDTSILHRSAGGNIAHLQAPSLLAEEHWNGK